MSPFRKYLAPVYILGLAVLTALACAAPSFQPPATPVQAGVFPNPATPPAKPGADQVITTPAWTAGDPQLYVNLYKKVNPSVVLIRILDASGVEQALGSGFVYDTDGHIVTNNHVVEGAAQLEVDFDNGFKALGKVVGAEPTADLAVVKIDAPAGQLTALPLADSDAVQVGQQVIAIGNPFGFSGTMTTGIVSGLGRVLTANATVPGGGNFSAPDIIQTDAAINPGNSGGPLLNLDGQVIGINKAIESSTGVNSGVGFAVASNTIKRIVPALISTGKFQYPYLGVASPSDNLPLARLKSLGLPETPGVYVSNVTAGGPADKAGVRGDKGGQNGLSGGGDFIIAIDGHPIKAFADMLSYLVNHASVGQTVTLTVVRNGQNQDLPVVLGVRP